MSIVAILFAIWLCPSALALAVYIACRTFSRFRGRMTDVIFGPPAAAPVSRPFDINRFLIPADPAPLSAEAMASLSAPVATGEKGATDCEQIAA